MGNRDVWLTQVEAAAKRAGRRSGSSRCPRSTAKTWTLVADLKNIGGGRAAGTLKAGLFLKEFVAKGLPWAHLDIAGVAFTGEADGINPRAPPGSASAPSWSSPRRSRSWEAVCGLDLDLADLPVGYVDDLDLPALTLTTSPGSGMWPRASSTKPATVE